MIELDNKPIDEPSEAEELLGFRVKEGMVWVGGKIISSWSVPRIDHMKKAVEVIEKLLQNKT
jgi:hypothetical protein